MRALFAKRQNIFIKLIHDQALLTLEGLDALEVSLTPMIRKLRTCSPPRKKKPMKLAVS